LNAAAVSLAYKHCQQITRSRARNFYYGIRLLPPPKRSAMCALYAMARRIDDIGDDVSARHDGATGAGQDHVNANQNGAGRAPEDAERLAGSLAAVRASLALLAKSAAGGPPPPPGDPVLMAMADAARRYPLPLPALEELVEGCEWDLAGRYYQTFDDLVGYCRRVAGSIGRLSLAIYGSTDPVRAEALADALGVALQLTNILRDLVEDRDVYGRVYLPQEDLARFGVGPALDGKVEDMMALVCFESGRAEQWYEQGFELLGLLDRRSRACTAAMAGIYRRLLDKIRLDPASVLVRRQSLPRAEKARVAAAALLRGAA
jgi:phytoene synthase